MRNLLVSLANTEGHPAIEAQVSGRRDRSFEKKISKAERLLELMRRVPLPGPSGTYSYGFDLDNAMVDRFLERISRGVLYDAQRTAFFSGSFSWALLPIQEGKLLFSNPPPELFRKTVGNIFSYICCDEPVEGYWYVNLRFYENFFALGRFKVPDSPSSSPN